MNDLAVLAWRQIRHHVADVRRVERRRLGRHPARKISVPDDDDAVRCDNLLVGFGQLAIAAALSCEVDDDTAGLHRLYHVLRPQHWRVATGDERGGDDDIHLGRDFAELLELRFTELRARRRGIPTCRGTVLQLVFEFEVDELGAHQFDLFGNLRAYIEGVRYRAQRCRRADGGEPRNARSHH